MITEALKEYEIIVKRMAHEYSDCATVQDVRADHDELDFLEDSEIQTMLNFAKAERKG